MKTSVSIAWNRSDAARMILVLAHGAGGDLNDPLLTAAATGLIDHGVSTARFNFPYREAGRKAPGAQSQSEDAYRAVASSCRMDGLPLVCGGKSYGGRIASHIASAGYEMDALVFLSFPLHPPGKPDRLRDEHLGSIDAPMLFVQGTRDPFATRELLEATVDRLPTAKLVSIEGGDHSLRVPRRKTFDVHAEIVDAIAAFLSSL